MNFIDELKRRNVIRVGVAYLVVSWLLLQVVDVLTGVLGLPDNLMQVVALFASIGLAPVLIFSWVFEMTPEGIKRESEITPDETARAHTTRKLDQAIIGLLVVAIGLFAFQAMRTPVVEAPPQETTAEVVRPEASELEASVAVLPFVNMSGNQENEYFSDGLSETLLHMLAQVSDLRVAARTSSFQFKGRNEDVREIARQLGVATILEGSVQRAGDRVRITAQLVRGDDGSHIWSQNFDRTLDDIFTTQDEIAAAVSEALTHSLLGNAGSAGSSSVGGTQIIAAYDAFMQGREALNRGTPEGATEGLAKLELAVQLDPDYGLAWAWLADARVGPARLGLATWESTWGPSREAAERALAVAPDLAEAHLAIATTANFDDRVSVRASIDRAIELNSNSAEAHAALSQLLGSQGSLRDALSSAQRAAILSPLDQDIRITLAFRKAAVGLTEDAQRDFQALLAESPGSAELLWIYGRFQRIALDDVSGSIQTLHEAHEISPDFLGPMFLLTFAYLDVGDVEIADAWLRRIEAISPQRAFDDRASFCLQVGDLDCFVEYSERYIELQRGVGGDEIEYYRFESVRQYAAGEYESALEALLPLVDIPASDFSSAPEWSQLLLALTYGALGMEAEREAWIVKLRRGVQGLVENGAPRLSIIRDLVRLAAVEGDAAEAAQLLSEAIDAGAQVPSNAMEHYAIFDLVRDDPAFQAQVERARAREAELRAELRAMGL